MYHCERHLITRTRQKVSPIGGVVISPGVDVAPLGRPCEEPVLRWGTPFVAQHAPFSEPISQKAYDAMCVRDKHGRTNVDPEVLRLIRPVCDKCLASIRSTRITSLKMKQKLSTVTVMRTALSMTTASPAAKLLVGEASKEVYDMRKMEETKMRHRRVYDKKHGLLPTYVDEKTGKVMTIMQ